MRRKSRPAVLLLVGILSIVGLVYFIIYYSPNIELRIGSYELGVIYPFFMLIFLSFFSLAAYLFNNKRRGLFTGFFVVLYLYLRLVKLTHPFFLILIIALFVTIELFFSRQK